MRLAYGVVAAYIHHTGDILFSRAISAKGKMLSFCAGFGYTLPVMILALFIFGTFSFVTNRPAPIDLPKFFSDLAVNIILTSGLIVASIVSLYKVGKLRYLTKMILSSFSIGIVTTLYVNKGIFKSLFGEPMEWFLLNKNTDVSSVK